MTTSVDHHGVPYRRLTIDYGAQGEAGRDARVVGTLGNGLACEPGDAVPWTLRTLSTQAQVPFVAQSDAEGRLWLVAGIDSAFAGRTDVYLTALRVRLEPAVAAP